MLLPRLCFACLTALAISSSSALAATDVAGVSFEDHASVGAQELVLNGAGLRTRLFFKVYAMGLYLPQRAATPVAALASKGPRRIQIVTLRELSGEQLADALHEGLQKNLSPTEQTALATRIEDFRKLMVSLGKAPEKTVILLDYLPESGTRLTVAGEKRGADIAGEDFYLALLRIWLGAEPAQEDLRAALLGQKQ